MLAAILIPDFFLQAVLRHEEKLHVEAVALIDPGLTPPTVVQLSHAARLMGIVPGMTPPQALARCPKLILKNRSIPQEAAAAEILLQCAFAFSPAIEATSDGICTLDLKGLSQGGDQAWAEKIIAALLQFHLHAQVGVAETPALARHAAHLARPFLAVTDSTRFLASLPLEALQPEPSLLRLLRKWGLRTAGEFLALSKEELAERFDAKTLALVETASGRKSRPLQLVRPSEQYRETIDFEHEVESLEPLLFILRRFIDQILRRLELVFLVVEELRLSLRLSSGDAHECTLKVPAPTGDIDVLFRMLHTHLEGVRTEHPIIGLTLEAKPSRPMRRQFHLFEMTLRNPNQFFETLARLTSMLGENRVGTPVPEASHRPDAFRMAMPAFDTAIPAASASNPPPSFTDGLALRRYRPPLPAVVQLRDGVPAFVHTATVAGVISDSQGPWHSSGDWWSAQPWQREEWDICLGEGRICRLYREGHDWFMEGIYD